MQDLKILHLEVNDTGLESYYRVLVNGKYFKYTSINSGVYDVGRWNISMLWTLSWKVWKRISTVTQERRELQYSRAVGSTIQSENCIYSSGQLQSH
jgi:hypothetical protein